MTHFDILQKAENLEQEAKNSLNNKKYDETISLLMQAKKMYSDIGLGGQEAIIIKKIVHVQNLKKEANKKKFSLSEMKTDFDLSELEANGNNLLEKARNLALNEQYEDALSHYNEAYNIFKNMNHAFEIKQILWQINEIKDHLKWKSTGKGIKNKIAIKDIVALVSAEKRRAKIQSGLQSRISTQNKPREAIETSSKAERNLNKPKLFQQMDQQIKKQKQEQEIQIEIRKQQEDIRKLKIRERREKIRILQEKKKNEEELQKQVENLLDDGNKAIKEKNFDQARSSYENAIKILTRLGWFNEVRTLQKELRNIDVHEKEKEKKELQKKLTKQKYQDEFRKRVEKAQNEKDKYLHDKINKIEDLPREIKQKLEKVELIKRKAKKEEDLQMFQRVISRYQYIREIYQSIDSDEFDFSNEIALIEAKLSELKGKK